MRRLRFPVLLALLGVLILASAANARALRAPAPAGPANGIRVQQLPTITWAAVRRAARYEYQIAADPRFSSIALGNGSGKGTNRTHNLAATLDKTVPDGTYYWRVRAVTAKDSVGSWSRTRRIVKAWTTAPQITGGDGAAVSWPSTPLVLSWSSVPYASKYIVRIATDPALSNVVVGTAAKPQETQGINFALPASLAPGAYYWDITPVDAEGRRGARSPVATFQWSWPTATATSLTDLNPDSAVFDPMFSWNPVPGAARYEVEVNSAEDFPVGSKWCCTGTTTGTSLAPLKVLANNRYYWRVRAVDARGNAGVWNYGSQFTKAFDSVTPSIPNLTVSDTHGNPLAGVPETDTPIVTWSPVPGASHYQVQLAPYGEAGCDWSAVSKNSNVYQADTATTAWTPLGTSGHLGPTAWPNPQRTTPLTPGKYCLRVLARSDDDAQGGQVISGWTQINGADQPAFTYTAPPPPGALEKPFLTPLSAYLQPTSGTLTSRTPWFTWNRVAGAQGYYVVIARDAGFTQVADIGFTNVPAYAPRLANDAPLSDETTAYYWAVIPATGAAGGGVSDDVPQDNNAQSFNKASTPPTPIGPTEGANISAQPTFQWSSAENARNYRLQVSQDPTFGKPIDDVTTDATAYTSSSTYPADTVIYWRVRTNDWTGQGLNWSPTRSFVRRLPVPVPASSGPTTLLGIPPISWTPIQGAISYDIQVEQPDGTHTEFHSEGSSSTFDKYWGTGIGRWQVRAEFPTGAVGNVAGGYSSPQPVLLTLAAPRGARGVKAGSRILVSWNPEPDAKRYQVEISTTNGFNSRIDSHTVDGTTWTPDIDLGQKQNRGTLFWRVAPVDERGGVGSFASGRFGTQASRACSRIVKTGKTRSARKRAHRAHTCVKKRPAAHKR
jgi:hypothetical protein